MPWSPLIHWVVQDSHHMTSVGVFQPVDLVAFFSFLYPVPIYTSVLLFSTKLWVRSTATLFVTQTPVSLKSAFHYRYYYCYQYYFYYSHCCCYQYYYHRYNCYYYYHLCFSCLCFILTIYLLVCQPLSSSVWLLMWNQKNESDEKPEELEEKQHVDNEVSCFTPDLIVLVNLIFTILWHFG